MRKNLLMTRSTQRFPSTPSSPSALLAALLALLLLTGCSRRDLEDIVTDSNNLRVEVDWLTRFGQQPNGMTFGLWRTAGSTVYVDETNTVTRHSLPAIPDDYNLLVFNQTATELDMFRFDLSSYADASVTLRPNERRVHDEWDSDITFAELPDPLGVATDTISIAESMLVDGTGFQRHPRTRSVALEDADGNYYYRLTPQDETSLLSVRIRVLGLKNLGTVEGGLSGMAAQYLLSRHTTSSAKATHLLERAEWRAVLDAGDDAQDGWIMADIRVLGLPDSHTRGMADRDSTLNHLTLSFLLADAKTPFRFDRDVGNLIRYVDERPVQNPQTGEWTTENYYVDYPTRHLFLVVSSVPLPDLPDVEQAVGGFDAEVDLWQKGDTSEIEM